MTVATPNDHAILPKSVLFFYVFGLGTLTFPIPTPPRTTEQIFTPKKTPDWFELLLDLVGDTVKLLPLILNRIDFVFTGFSSLHCVIWD